jgi:hypothetical protein
MEGNIQNNTPTLLQQADATFREKSNRFLVYASQNWLRYAALVCTGILTGIAGWTLTSNIFYTTFLILLAEGASLFWTARAEDNGNPTQAGISIVGTAVAWIAIVLTDLSSATILASQSNIKIFSIFATVPVWAQSVVTYVLPTLAVTHGVLGTTHYFFSEEARLKRDLAKTEREARRAIAQAEAEAKQNIAKAQADKFKELAEANAEGIGRDRGEKLWDKTYNKAEAAVQTNDLAEQLEIVHGNNGRNPTKGSRK